MSTFTARRAARFVLISTITIGAIVSGALYLMAAPPPSALAIDTHCALAPSPLASRVSVSTYTDLATAINETSFGESRIITLESDISHPNFSLIIPAGRDITLTSSLNNTFELHHSSTGDDSAIIVHGTLRLQNITFSGNRHSVPEESRTGGIRATGSDACLFLDQNSLITASNNIVPHNLTFDSFDHLGGGINAQNDATIIIRGGSITDNSADYGGGGIALLDSTLIMHDGQISSNVSVNTGGGIYADTSTITMNGGIISNNTSYFGGGVDLNNNSKMTMRGNSLITGNTALMGGGINSVRHRWDFPPEEIIPQVYISLYDSATISHNHATRNGGGISFINHGTITLNPGTYVSHNTVGFEGFSARSGSSGAGLHIDDQGSLFVDSATISHNHHIPNDSGGGGGIYFASSSSQLVIKNSHIDHNSAGFGGGIIFAGSYLSPKYISNTSISHNTGLIGGGLALISFSSFGLDPTLLLDNTIISHNQAILGAGIYAEGIYDETQVDILNSTISHNIAHSFDDIWGIPGQGGGLHWRELETLENIHIANTTFYGNFADSGFSTQFDGPEVDLTNHTAPFEQTPNNLTWSQNPLLLSQSFTNGLNNFDITNPNDPHQAILVTFDSQGGSFVPHQAILANNPITPPDYPTNPGHIFIEWRNKNDLPWDFATTISANTTLFAHWLIDDIIGISPATDIDPDTPLVPDTGFARISLSTATTTALITLLSASIITAITIAIRTRKSRL